MLGVVVVDFATSQHLDFAPFATVAISRSSGSLWDRFSILVWIDSSFSFVDQSFGAELNCGVCVCVCGFNLKRNWILLSVHSLYLPCESDVSMLALSLLLLLLLFLYFYLASLGFHLFSATSSSSVSSLLASLSNSFPSPPLRTFFPAVEVPESYGRMRSSKGKKHTPRKEQTKIITYYPYNPKIPLTFLI